MKNRRCRVVGREGELCDARRPRRAQIGRKVLGGRNKKIRPFGGLLGTRVCSGRLVNNNKKEGITKKKRGKASKVYTKEADRNGCGLDHH